MKSCMKLISMISHNNYYSQFHCIPCKPGWEPRTKQFYPKCQSPTVLPSSQSTCRIAAPSCIGSRPTSRQSIRDARPERQSVIQQHYSAQRTSDNLHQGATTLSQPTARAHASPQGHQDEPNRSPPGRDSLLFIPSFEVNANIQCVCVISH
jgi:hypothetical protein